MLESYQRDALGMSFSKCEEVLHFLISQGELNNLPLSVDTINFLEEAVKKLQYICGRIVPKE